MELAIFYFFTVAALLALGGFSFYQTLRAVDMERKIKILSERADSYAGALLTAPDMGGLLGVEFTSDESRTAAVEYAAAKKRGQRHAKPTAEDFARYVPQELRSPRTPMDAANNLQPPGANPDTIRAAAARTPMQRVVIHEHADPLPAMLASAGVLLAAAASQRDDTAPCEVDPAPTPPPPAEGGSVTTPGGFD